MHQLYIHPVDDDDQNIPFIFLYSYCFFRYGFFTRPSVRKLFLVLLLVFTNHSFANEEPANCCPEIYKGLNADKLIKIHFTDLIEDRYIVYVEWFPDNGLAPFLTGPANITFTLKESNKSFTLRTEFYHSPDFEVDWEKINTGEVFEMKYSDFNNQTTLKELAFKKGVYSLETPFFFEDVNFDGTKELIITEARNAQRHRDGYKVYSMYQNRAVISLYDITNSLPYVNFDSSTEFNPKDKPITLYYSGGACTTISETYKAVAGYRTVKFQLIKGWETYFWDDDGNDIGCHKKIYDIVNGREVLNVAESGPVD